MNYKKLEKKENIDKNAVKNIMNLNIKNILRVEKIYCKKQEKSCLLFTYN